VKRRVAITGCGAVTPIGTGIPAYYDGLRTARSGISTIARFDAATFASRVAGEVKDLDWIRTPLPAGGEAALRRDPKSVFGLVAAREALDQAFGTRAPASYYPARRIGTWRPTSPRVPSTRPR
jgi:3-oxoacyl-[acyl-carrier-protein] synthase II